MTAFAHKILGNVVPNVSGLVQITDSPHEYGLHSSRRARALQYSVEETGIDEARVQGLEHVQAGDVSIKTTLETYQFSRMGTSRTGIC